MNNSVVCLDHFVPDEHFRQKSNLHLNIVYKRKTGNRIVLQTIWPNFFFVRSICLYVYCVCFYSSILFVRSSHFPLVRYQRVNKTAWNANASNRIISCMFWRILHTIQNNRDIDRKYLYKVFILKTTNVLHEHRSLTLLLTHSLSICVLISFGKQMNSSCYSLCAM